MAKIFHTCFNPYTPREKPPISSAIDGELASGLFSSLAIDLQELRESLEDKSISLQWCSVAMLFIRKMHSHFLLFTEKYQVPMSLDRANAMDEYLRESLDLLDTCILLKSAISGISRYKLMVDFVEERLSDDGYPSARNIRIKRPAAGADDNLFDIKRWKDKVITASKTKLKCSNMHDIHAISTAMKVISVLVCCSILHPIPLKLDVEVHNHEFARCDFISGSIQKLVSCFEEIFRCAGERGRLFLSESSMVEDAMAEFTAKLTEGKELEKEKISESLDMIRKRSLALKEGLDSFESVVNEVFEDVLVGRKKVLGLFTTKHYALIK
ncbi:hypothetical protein Nepgr_023641 [Nepenthes gracilis]|uniref:Uncharacterized protein n=1 Tax=Nepenthes gracilis TaxID=150966 RepID=A0AAD3T3F4_NEPGR|nr:hypothetical protein Nepgr_023641 [Nepenthes gracilis]